MAEFRHKTTGEVKTKEEWKKHFKNVSTPNVWNQNVFDALNIDPILPGLPASTSTYQISVRDGVEQDSKGNWVEKYIAKDMFSTTEDKEKYQKNLDDEAAANVRAKRNLLLQESDWTVLADSPLSTTKQNEWKAYRKTLRDIPTDSGFPHSITFPDKPS